LAAATALASFAAATVDALVALVGWIKTGKSRPPENGGFSKPPWDLLKEIPKRNFHHFLGTKCYSFREGK